MQVSVETTSAIERRVTISVPAAEVDEAVDAKLRELVGRVRIDGFRPGKVPFKVVKQRYGAGVRQEVMGDVMNKNYMQALQQEDIQPAGYPEVTPKVMEEGKDFEFVATLEIYPQVTICDFSKITVDKPVVEANDKDVQNTIQNIREQAAQWQDVDRAAALKDQVFIDYSGTKDGEPFEGGSAKNSPLELGSGRMIAGFEDAIVGLTEGQSKSVELTFPEDYHAEELQDAAVVFEITVNKVQEKQLPALDQELFEKYGVEEGGEQAFTTKIKENVEKNLEQRVKDEIKKQVMDGLIEHHSVTVPKAILKAEIDALRQRALQQFGGMNNQDIDFASMLPDDLFSEEGERRAKLGLIIAAITKQHEIEADETRVDSLIDELAASYQDPEQVREYYQQEQQRANLRSLVIEDMIVENILEKAQQQDTVMTYEELINPQPKAESESNT